LAALLHADDGGAVPLDKAPRLAGASLSIVHGRDMGQRRWRFNPSSGWRRRSAPCAAAAHARRADLADIAEQVLQEAALAAQRRRLVVLRIDPRDLIHAPAVGGDDVAGF